MGKTTTALGRMQVQNPELLFDTSDDGGAALYAVLNSMFKQFSDHTATRWIGDVTLAASASQELKHNFGQAVGTLKVFIFEAGAQLTKAQREASYTVTAKAGDEQNTILVQNTTGGPKTFSLLVLGFKLGVEGSDLDPAVVISTTGTVTASKLSATGDDIDLNSDASGTGTDRKATLRRGAGMSTDAVIELPSQSGKLIADSTMPLATATPAAVTVGASAVGVAVKVAREDHAHKLVAHDHSTGDQGGPMGLTGIAAVTAKAFSALVRDENGAVANAKDVTGAVILPAGTTAQRPTLTASDRAIRFNTDAGSWEGWNGTGWTSIGSGSSGLNLVKNPDAESGLSDVTATGNWTRASTASAILGTKSFALSRTSGGAAGDMVTWDTLAVPSFYVGKALQLNVKTKCEVGDGGKAQIAILEDSTVLAYTARDIPEGDYQFQFNFTPKSGSTYKPVTVSKTTSAITLITVDDVRVEEVKPIIGIGGTKTVSFTPQLFDGSTPLTGLNYGTCVYKITNGTVEMSLDVRLGTQSGTNALNMVLPDGLLLDTTAHTIEGSGNDNLGSFAIQVPNVMRSLGAITTSGSQSKVYFAETDAVTATSGFLLTPANLTGAELKINLSFSAQGYSSNVTLANRSTEEYATNNSATTANDSTSFSNDFSGFGFQPFAPTGTNAVVKRVRFPSNHQPGDKFEVVLGDGTTFIPLRDRTAGFSFNDAGTTFFGYQMSVVNSTDIDVYFYSAPFIGASWSEFASQKWKVTRVRQGALTGIGTIESRYIQGVTDGIAALAGKVGEIIEATSAGVAATTTNTAFTVASLPLPAGSWEVTAYWYFVPGTVTGNTYVAASLNGIPSETSRMSLVNGAANTDQAGTCFSIFIDSIGASTAYLMGRYNFTTLGTSKFANTCVIRARRIR